MTEKMMAMGNDSGRTVSFSFDTADELAEFKRYAKGRGLTLSQFVKFAAYQYRERYPGIKRDKAAKPRKAAVPAKGDKIEC